MNGLLGRAVLAFVLMPGIVAFLVPWLLIAPRASAGVVNYLGLVPLAAGTGLLLWCAGAFYVAGRGTLAPWDPPRRLVSTGVYRFSRNPMYVAVVLILWGWALAFLSWPVAIYSSAVMLAFYLRVVFGEEPWLARTHKEEWTRYEARVPRWIGWPRDGRGGTA